MMNPSRFAWLILILATTPCAAQVDDAADLFSPDARRRAETRIKETREQTGKQIMVYTLKAAPEDVKKEFNLDDAGQAKEAFDKLARERMKTVGLDGVHLLICEDPRHIQITVSENAQHLFDPKEQKQLKSRMIGKFQPDSPDQNFFHALRNKLRSGPDPNVGLLEALDYINLKFDHNRPIDQTNFYLGLGIMAGILGAWIILGIARARLRKRTPAAAGVHSADESGRSIAVLGGGIGAVSGQWFATHLFGRQPAESLLVAVENPPEPSAENADG